MRSIHRALVLAACAALAAAIAGCAGRRAAGGDAPAASHDFHVLPAGAAWGANPSITAGSRIAVVAGRPTQPGLYALRVIFPADHRVLPHSHPEERIYTVLAGTFHIGLGSTFDEAKLQAYPAGSSYLLPAGTVHFQWTRSGEAVVQVNGMGPTATNYANPADDPRRR